MSDELTAVEESITKVLLDLMIERIMSKRGVSTGVQASSTRGLSASPSTTRVGPSQQVDEK
jgi:type II secretory pathway component PulK